MVFLLTTFDCEIFNSMCGKRDYLNINVTALETSSTLYLMALMQPYRGRLLSLQYQAAFPFGDIGDTENLRKFFLFGNINAIWLISFTWLSRAFFPLSNIKATF